MGDRFYPTPDAALRAYASLSERAASPRGTDLAGWQRYGAPHALGTAAGSRASAAHDRAIDRVGLGVAIGRVSEPHVSVWKMYVLGDWHGGWEAFARYVGSRFRGVGAWTETRCRTAVRLARVQAGITLREQGLIE